MFLSINKAKFCSNCVLSFFNEAGQRPDKKDTTVLKVFCGAFIYFNKMTYSVLEIVLSKVKKGKKILANGLLINICIYSIYSMYMYKRYTTSNQSKPNGKHGTTVHEVKHH